MDRAAGANLRSFFTTKSRAGTGLGGDGIRREEQSGGYVWVSEAQGSMFSVYLPPRRSRARASDRPASRLAVRGDPARRGRERFAA